MDSKHCTKCWKPKSLDSFRKQSKNKDGRKYICKECDNKIAKNRYEQKKEFIIEKVRDWQFRNNERVKEYKLEYYKRNSK